MERYWVDLLRSSGPRGDSWRELFGPGSWLSSLGVLGRQGHRRHHYRVHRGVLLYSLHDEVLLMKVPADEKHDMSVDPSPSV